jgi:hypothetical protein
MIYLDRLNYFLEILAAKRTPEEEAKDRADLKKRLAEKEAKDEARRSEKGQKPLKYKKDATKTKPSQEKKQADIKDVIAKLQAIKEPHLFIIDSNTTSVTPKGDIISDEDKKENRKKYSNFIDDPSIKDALNFSVNITNVEGVHGWICDLSHIQNLKSTAFAHNLVEESVELPDDMLKQKNPFEKCGFDLDDKSISSKVKVDLLVKWEPIYTSLNPDAKKDEEKETKDEDTKDDVPSTEDKPDEVKKDADEEDKVDDADREEEDTDESEKDLDIEDAPRLRVGRFRSLEDPYIFILDPRKKSGEYQTFLDKEDPKSSKILPKALKLLSSKKLKSQEGYPVLVYFLNKKDTAEIKKELEREVKPDYLLGAFNKDLFDTDSPFTDLKVRDTVIEQPLIDELNKVWMEATSEASGNPISAVQINSSVPLSFFRFLSKKQRPIELYIGGRPEGAGSRDTVYVLASEHEANSFVRTLRRFKMPSLFYEKLSANSDIDPEFKELNPETVTPENVLVLIGSFTPKEIITITVDNIELASVSKPRLKDKLKKINELKKEQEKQKDVSSTKLADVIKKAEEDVKISQLELLHAFAKANLENRTHNPGAFIKHKGMIGTHIAQFNADMTICFLWGSHTRHVTVDPKEVVKQLPFVKTVITSYL